MVNTFLPSECTLFIDQHFNFSDLVFGSYQELWDLLPPTGTHSFPLNCVTIYKKPAEFEIFLQGERGQITLLGGSEEVDDVGNFIGWKYKPNRSDNERPIECQRPLPLELLKNWNPLYGLTPELEKYITELPFTNGVTVTSQEREGLGLAYKKLIWRQGTRGSICLLNGLTHWKTLFHSQGGEQTLTSDTTYNTTKGNWAYLSPIETFSFNGGSGGLDIRKEVISQGV